MKPIKNLVLSGGGLRGYSYISLIKIIDEDPDNFQLERIAGTSVGAIFATLIAIGISYDEVCQKTINRDIGDFQNVKLDNIIKYMERFGIDDGRFFSEFVGYFMVKKFSNPDITFQELYQKTKIELYITGTSVTQGEPVYFSHLTFPDMSVLLAIRISISIPFYFIPIYYEKNLYVDGGVIDNFPIQLFKDNMEDTLGIFLLNNKITKHNIESFEDYAYSIFFATTGKRDIKKVEQYKPFCVSISLTDVGIYSKSLSQETRSHWEAISYSLITLHLENRKLHPPISNNNINDNAIDNTTDIKNSLKEKLHQFIDTL